MHTSRARGRAENSPYLHIGDVQFSSCSNTELARCKMRFVCEAVQRELADGRSEAVAIVINVVPFAPLRMPKAWRLTGAVDDSCSAAPAVVIKLRGGSGFIAPPDMVVKGKGPQHLRESLVDRLLGVTGPFIGLGNHLNGCTRDFIPRSG